MINSRLALAFAAVAAATTPAAVQARGAPFAVAISHHDLDLTTPRGQARWLDRVSDTGERTCAHHRRATAFKPGSIRACRALFTAAAKARIAELNPRADQLAGR